MVYSVIKITASECNACFFISFYKISHALNCDEHNINSHAYFHVSDYKDLPDLFQIICHVSARNLHIFAIIKT